MTSSFGFCGVCIVLIMFFIMLLYYTYKYLKDKSFENLGILIWLIIMNVYAFSFLYCLNKVPIYNTYAGNGELIQIYVVENSSNFMFGYAYEISCIIIVINIVILIAMILQYKLDKIECGNNN